MRERKDARALADRDPGPEGDVWFDHDIAAKHSVGAQKHGLRRHQGNARSHRGQAQPVLHQCLCGGKFGAVVDADQLLGWKLDRAPRQPLAAGDPDDVGQIEFALLVVAIEGGDEVASDGALRAP